MVEKTEFDAEVAANAGMMSLLNFDAAVLGQFAMVPQGFSVESLEQFQRRPNRHIADHRFVSIASLIEYLNRFACPETMIAADSKKASIECCIDGDRVDEPSFKDHRATFLAQQSDKLRAWREICNKPMTQVQFGLFLEERAVDVVVPEAASVMDMVMTFDATKKVTFKSSLRLQDGSRQFQYVEDNEARGGVTLPDHFIILAPVYRGMEPQRIKFLVRYRIEEGALRFVVQMHDEEEVMREAFERCVDALQTGLDAELPVYWIG
jgi:uncharacterized protein YfdQ (DUF2303 family)